MGLETIDKFPLSLAVPGISALPHMRDASLLHHLCGHVLDSLKYVHVPCVLGNPELDTVLQKWPHHGGAEGRITLLNLLATLLLMQPRMLLVSQIIPK